MTRSSGSNNGGGCFSAIARLLLCRGSLQTHPSDQILTAKPFATADHIVIEHSNDSPLMANLKIEAPLLRCPTTPGVVARLMGLDSLPDTNWMPKSRRSTPDLVSRSRSVNFMDYLVDSDFDLKQLQDQKHRRVRTSVSFREVPDQGNDKQDLDLFVFLEKNTNNRYRTKKWEANFDNTKQRTELEKNNKKEYVKRRNAESVRQKPHEKKTDKKMNLKDVERRTKPVVSTDRRTSRVGSCQGSGGQVSSGFVSPRKKDGVPVRKMKIPVKLIHQKEVLVESKFMKKVKSQYAKSDCSSEDSSPISVRSTDEEVLLHHHHHRQMQLSDKKYSTKSTDMNQKVSRSTEGVKHKKGVRKNGCREEVRKLRRLTEEDMKESKWVVEFENTEEICLYFGELIMDLLLKQVVEELMEE